MEDEVISELANLMNEYRDVTDTERQREIESRMSTLVKMLR
jgi:hypothetical protein